MPGAHVVLVVAVVVVMMVRVVVMEEAEAEAAKQFAKLGAVVVVDIVLLES